MGAQYDDFEINLLEYLEDIYNSSINNKEQLLNQLVEELVLNWSEFFNRDYIKNAVFKTYAERYGGV